MATNTAIEGAFMFTVVLIIFTSIVVLLGFCAVVHDHCRKRKYEKLYEARCQQGKLLRICHQLHITNDQAHDQSRSRLSSLHGRAMWAV
jgi:hypothetical protein